MMLKLKQALHGVFTMSGVGLEQQFRAFDTNGDGDIDHDEFREGLYSLGAQISETQVADLITMLDKDGDGTIDYHEFGRWFGKGPPPAPPTPEMKTRAAAKEAAGDMGDLLAQIRASGGAKRSSTPPRRANSGGGGGGGRDDLFAELRKAAASRSYGAPTAGSAPAAITAVLTAMRTHTSNASVQHAGCQALWSMAYKNDNGRAAIAASGGVPALVFAMSTYGGSALVQAAAAAALASLAVDDQLAATIAHAGAKDLVIAALSRHVDDAAVSCQPVILSCIESNRI